MNKTFLAFTVGIVAGILLAPAKGTETREKLQRNADDLKNKWNRMLRGKDTMFENAISTIEESTGKIVNPALGY